MMDQEFPNFDIGDVESLFASSGNFSLDSPPSMLNDDPQVSSSIHPNASVLGDDGGSSTVGSLLGGPHDTHSNVSSTTTDHQASQFLGHLDGVSGTPSSSTNPHDDIFFTGNSSRPPLNTGSNTLQGQNTSGSMGINNLFSNNNGASSKGGPPSQQGFGPPSVSAASSVSNPSPQQPHTPHTPRAHPIPSPGGAAPIPSPVYSVPMASPVASLPPPSPAQVQHFSKPLRSPASVQSIANSIKSPMSIPPPSPSPSGPSLQVQPNTSFHSSNTIRPTSVAQSSVNTVSPIIRSVAPVTQTQQLQTAQGQVLLSAQPTLIQGGSAVLTGTPVMPQGVPTLIQTATGGLMQISLPPQLSTIGSVSNPVNVPSAARLPLSLNSLMPSTVTSSLITSIPQTSTTYSKTVTTRQQPQLLPKYSSSAGGKPKSSTAAPLQYTIAATQNAPLAQSQTLAAGASPLLLSTGGAVLQTLQGVATASQQQAAANPTVVLGQNLVIGNPNQTNSPFLIQQPNGNPPVIMVRSNSQTIQPSTPTILPIVSQAPGAQTGALLLQQPQPATPGTASSAGVITAQPQVKIITPQGRMQVQQIQTPSGPKLITVPVGQGISGQTTTIVPQAIQTASPTIPGIGGTTAIGQLQQLGGNVPAAFASLGTPTIVSSLPNNSLAAPASSSLPSSLIQSVPTMGGMGLPSASQIPTPNVVGTSTATVRLSNTSSDTTNQLTATPKSSGTKKKGKRKSKKPDPMAAATTAVVNSALEAVGQKPPTSRTGGLDLGELMKDVGLDLEGFGVDEASAQAALSAAGNVTAASTLPIVPHQGFNASQSSIGNMSLPSAAAAAVQGISLPGGSFSITGASAANVSGVSNIPLLSNTQPVAASTTLSSVQGVPLPSPGNQLVAQLQQPLPLQPTTANQLQLVQGPDGQFILQSAPAPTQAAPTILSQTSIANQPPGQFTNTTFLSSNATLSMQQPTSLAVAGVSTTNTTYTLQPSLSNSLPTPTLTSVIEGQQLLQQQQLQQQPTLLSELSLPTSSIQPVLGSISQIGVTPTFIGSTVVPSTVGAGTTVTPALSAPVTSGATSKIAGAASGTSAATTVGGATPAKTKRSNVDPNRSPLYLDTRLPQGWHRKVSQRKSGASAGRYEVFIIGPTGKRFRSRNEMRAFFDKTSNDSNIDPDDFDFSIFGSNNITSGRAPPKTQTGPSQSVVPSVPPMPSPKKGPNNITKKGQSTGPSTPSLDKVHLPDVVPTSSAGTGPTTSALGINAASILGLTGIDANLMQTASSVGSSTTGVNTNILNSTLPIGSQPPSQKSNMKGNLVSDIMKNLEKIGMASVDAAKAARAAADQVREGMDSPSGSATSSEILQRLTDPLPQKPLTIPSDSAFDSLLNQRSNLMPSNEELSQALPGAQILQSQLSMETADADAQISQLLETLQKDPKQLVVEGEKIAEFINSLTAGDDLDSSSPIPPTPTDGNNPLIPGSMSTSSQQSTSANDKQSANQHSLNLSGTTQGSASPFQQQGQGTIMPETNSNVISKAPELTSGTTGFQASFLNSLASSTSQQQESSKRSGASHEFDSNAIINSITNPVLPQTTSMPNTGNTISGMNGNQPTSKSQAISPNLSSAAVPSPHHLVSANPVTLGGGAPSQMRAMQNLPQNTRLVRGPNGQYSLQKVHTIELSQEMQANLRVVQTKIHEIEQKSTKNPRDEAELAQLQTKQQQILSTGKPIEGAQNQTFTSQQPSSTISQQQSLSAQTSILTGGSPIVATKSAPPAAPRYNSNLGSQAVGLPTSGAISSNRLNSSLASNASSAASIAQLSSTLLPTKPDTSLTSSSSTNSIFSSLNSQHSGSVGPSSSTVSSGAIPPLTEQQKKIVHEFKQKMASLPPEQQASFIKEHKTNLIKQLDFQPYQIQHLRSNDASQQQQLKSTPQSMTQTPKLPTQPLKPSMINMNSGNGGQLVRQKPLPMGAGTITTGIKIPTMGGQGIDSSSAANIPKQLLSLQPQLNAASATISSNVISGHTSIPGMVLGSLKRPPPTAMADLLPSSGQPINKQKKIAWVESQIKKDQNEAVNPKYKTPFSSKEDACKRLLRYHVFDELDDSPSEMLDAEEKFEMKSIVHLKKYRSMLDKYHYLLVQESMRQVSSSEEVMLARLWDSDERQLLNNEKEDVKRGEIIELPELPESWSTRYQELYGKDEEHIVPQLSNNQNSNIHDVIDLLDDEDDDDKDRSVIKEQKDEKHLIPEDIIQSNTSSQFDNDKGNQNSFLGLKISRNLSGTWNMKQEEEESGEANQDSVTAMDGIDEYDEFESIKNELNTFDTLTTSSSPLTSSSTKPQMQHLGNSISGVTFKPVEDSDDDEEFSLRDVDTARAVGSILEGADDDMDDETGDEDSRHHHDVSRIHHHHTVDNDDDLSRHVMSVNPHPDDHQDIFYDDAQHLVVGSGFDDTGDNNSVQNAINSILDTLPQGERMETPDLNNITGFLDSIDDVVADGGVHQDQERDPVTEAAVNSIL